MGSLRQRVLLAPRHRVQASDDPEAECYVLDGKADGEPEARCQKKIKKLRALGYHVALLWECDVADGQTTRRFLSNLRKPHVI